MSNVVAVLLLLFFFQLLVSPGFQVSAVPLALQVCPQEAASLRGIQVTHPHQMIILR